MTGEPTPAQIEAAARAIRDVIWPHHAVSVDDAHRRMARAALTAAAQVQPTDCPSCGARTYVETPAGCRSPESHRPQPAPRTDDLRDLTLIVVSDPVWQHVTRMDGTQLAAALYAAGVRPPA